MGTSRCVAPSLSSALFQLARMMEFDTLSNNEYAFGLNLPEFYRSIQCLSIIITYNGFQRLKRLLFLIFCFINLNRETQKTK